MIIRLENTSLLKLDWFRDTVAIALPGIKDKLKVLDMAAQHLSLRDNLEGLEQLVIESDEKWREGERDFINHGLATVSPPTYPKDVIHCPYYTNAA